MDRLVRCLPEFSCCLCHWLLLVAFLVLSTDFSEDVLLRPFRLNPFESSDCEELWS